MTYDPYLAQKTANEPVRDLVPQDIAGKLAGGPQMTDLEAARAAAAAPKNGLAPVDVNEGPRQMPNPVKAVWSNAKYTPTPSLNEAMITSLENFDETDPALAQARHAFSLATETLKKISETRDPLSRDSSKTPEQKLLLMAGIADKAQERCTKAFDGAFKSLTSLAKDLDESLNKPLEATTHTALCQEIRTYVRNLPKDRRDAFVNDAVNRGDLAVMQSVLGAPSYLSEISDERKAIWLRAYREKSDPVAVKRLGVYRAAIDRVMQNGPRIFDEFPKAMGGDWKDVQRLRGQTDASDKALAALRGE